MTYNGSDKHKIALFNGKQDKLTAGSNITLTPLSDGTVQIDASGGGAGGDLGDLDDVVITSPTDGQALVYDAQNQEWINGNASGASAMSDLTDVQLTSLSDGQGLIYDATSQKWENVDLAYNVPIIYSADEREVGVWVDGKPLYQRTITLSSAISVASNTWVTIYTNTFIGGIEQIVSAIYHNMANGGVYNANYIKPNGNNLQYFFPGSGNLSISAGAKFTIWYTKTADTAGSGTWTPDGEYAHHYSTSEKVVGTWIDGSTLYSIVYDNLSISISADYSNTHTGLYPANGNVGIIIRCICIDTYGQCFYSNGVKFISNNNELGISIPSNGARTITKIILEYTKSSS